MLEIVCGYLADRTYTDVGMTVEVASDVIDVITEVITDEEGGCVAVDATHNMLMSVVHTNILIVNKPAAHTNEVLLVHMSP